MIRADAALEEFAEIDSTLLEARRRAEAGALAPAWLVAHRQTAGRGRRGRAWASLDGNLMVTYLGETARAPAEIALLGFAAGLALAETLDAFAGAGRAALKWPNDVMLDGAKAAGVLIDSGAAGGGRAWFALSFGVNLAAAPEGLDQAATCLAAVTGAPAPTPLEFLLQTRTRLMIWDATLAGEGFEPLRAAWLSRAYALGEGLRVTMGAESLEGRFIGLSPRGELELETAEGRRLIAAGDVFTLERGRA